MGKALIYLARCSRLGNPHVEGKISLLPCVVPTSEDVHTSCDQKEWDVLEKKIHFTYSRNKMTSTTSKKYRFK